MAKKVKRFHRDVFFPSWYKTSMKKFMEELSSGKSITFSLHAVERTAFYIKEYGDFLTKQILKISRKDSLRIEDVFEFYSVDKEIKKVVLRFPIDNFPVDLVMVIAQDATVITLFVTNKGDTHQSMDTELYEKKE